MVTKLKDNFGYIKYIQEEMKKNLPDWQEAGASFEDQINNNFQINFEFLENKVSFVKDRGLLELRIFIRDNPIGLGYLLFNSILDIIPEQDKKWRTAICTELVDYYIHFLKSYFIRK